MANAETNCREVIASLWTYLDGEVGEVSYVQIEAHLHDCAPCLRRCDFEREVKTLIASRCREGKAPEELLARIRAALGL